MATYSVDKTGEPQHKPTDTDSQNLRICFRFRQKRPRTDEGTFVTDLHTLACSIGSPIWKGQGTPETEPLIWFGSRTAVLTYLPGDTGNVHAALNQRKITCEGLQTQRGTWTVALAKPQAQLQDELKQHQQERSCHFSSVNTDNRVCFAALDVNAVLPAAADVCAEGLQNPQNLGSIYRCMACLNFRKLFLVAADNSAAVPATWDSDVHISAKVRNVARGCEKYVERVDIARSALIERLRNDKERPPVVALETASGAVNIYDYKFPERCVIMVGAEGHGIDQRVVDALRPDFDAFVVIPMSGPHTSLNVATALAMGLYEYRRQWPAVRI